MFALSHRATTHLRVVRELSRVQRSSRWLNHEEVTPLFVASASAESLLANPPALASLRAAVAPCSACAHLHASRFAEGAWCRLDPSQEESRRAPRIPDPSHLEHRSGWKSLHRQRPVL
jgi:hypothetical protein